MPTPTPLGPSFWSTDFKFNGLLPFKTIVLSFKSRLAFYRVFFGSGSSSCGVSGEEGTEREGFIIIKTFPHCVYHLSGGNMFFIPPATCLL